MAARAELMSGGSEDGRDGCAHTSDPTLLRSSDDLSAPVLQALRDSGYRLTAPRRALVEALLAAEVPLRAEDVYDRVRPAGMNLSTVYRNLNTFVAMGWLDAVPGLNGERHYRVHQAQAPSLALVCLDCGKVNQLVVLPDPALGAAAHALGYKAESLRVQLAAHCNNECGRES
jgi:Fe2+ or Zn2+ uptake regulation protein